MALVDISSLEELETAIDDYLKTPKRPGLTGAEFNIILKKVLEFAPGTGGGGGSGLPDGGTVGQSLEKQSSTNGDAVFVDVPGKVQEAFEAGDAQIVDGAATAYNTLAKIATKLAAVEAIIDDGGDGDSIVNTVAELLAVFNTYPEGVDIITLIGGKVAIADIVNNLTQAVAGKVLDAAQGKVLKDLIDGLTTVVGGKQDSDRIGATFNGTLTFDRPHTAYNDYTVASNITIDIASSGKIQGTTEQVVMIGNGANLPNFSDCRQVANTPSFNNSNGYLNLVTFLYDGTRVWYYINQ